MNTNKSKYTTLREGNLIGQKRHRNFLEFQTEIGFSLSGGSYLPQGKLPSFRLIKDFNIIVPNSSNKKPIFSGIILN